VLASKTTALVLGIAVLSLVTATAETNAATADKGCGSVKSGKHTYTVRATKTSCSIADTWAARLARKRLPNYTPSGSLQGPKGYTCVGGTKSHSSPFTSLAPNVQTQGSCSKGIGGAFGNTPYFNWNIVLKSSG
jgi:hypothetical protein